METVTVTPDLGKKDSHKSWSKGANQKKIELGAGFWLIQG